jgi:outer membrane protein assembly factor BamE (lipoprotein component of BamABCDE complex)
MGIDPRRNPSSAIGRAMAGLLVLLVLTACQATYTNHGYLPPPEDIETLQIGATRDEVVDLIGSPGSSGVMRDEAWFYTDYRIRNFAYQPPEIIERNILAVSFNEAGRVQNIERYGLDDGRVVQFSRRVTTSSVEDIGILRSILSNFGQIDLSNLGS